MLAKDDLTAALGGSKIRNNVSPNQMIVFIISYCFFSPGCHKIVSLCFLINKSKLTTNLTIET
jgi:hypothetical protein